MERYRGGFLVTDGHHNRVYRVTLDGDVSEFIAFGNIVPTGLEVLGNTIYMAEAGPVPHQPADGKVVAFSPGSSTAQWSRLALGSSWTWSVAAVARSSPSRRVTSRAPIPRARACPPCQTPERS